MSIIVSVLEDGKERLYFRINSYGDDGDLYVDRPDRASVHVPNSSLSDTISAKVIAAVEAIEREDKKWMSVQEQNMNILFPQEPDQTI